MISKPITFPTCVTAKCPICKQSLLPGQQVVIDDRVRTIHLECVGKPVRFGPTETKVTTDWLKFED